MTVGNENAKNKLTSRKLNDVVIGLYKNIHKCRFSAPSSTADQRAVRMSKKDGVMSHGESTCDLKGYLDSLRGHGEHFSTIAQEI